VSRARASWAAFVAVMLLAAGLLLLDLGAGEWRTWDEALYARVTRNALEHDHYLYAVNEAGEYYRRFSKPPMSVWLSALSFSTLGASVTALRLPFALGMLATVGFAFGWGRRIGGLPMAIGWSVTLALCVATTRWGRHANIEPLFIAGLLGGLWAYHASVDAQDSKQARRFAAVAGSSLAFAVLTKQLAVGMAVLPIVALELWRRERSALPRLALTLGIPALVGIVWFAWAGAATDGAVFEGMLDRGLRRRIEGFGGGQNARTLNELASTVAETTAPIPWVLGAAGLALLCITRPREELRKPGPALLLPLWFAGNVLILDNVSRSMLPWYALHIVVPVLGGAGWLIAATMSRAGRSPRHMARAGLGWGCAGAAAITASEGLVSQLDVALVGGALLIAGTLKRPAVVRTTALVGVLLLMIGARLRDPELHPPDQPYSPLIAELEAHPRVAVDRRNALPDLGMRGLFGPHAKQVTRAPWPTTDYDAYVIPVVLPTEYEPPEGVQIHRTAGATAFTGDLTQQAWTRTSIDTLLERGPVTFEAEHTGASGWSTTYEDPDASGGAVRRHALFLNEKPPKLPLSVGPTLKLPAGHYTLEVWMRWSCPEHAAERTAAIVVAGTSEGELVRENLACEDGPSTLDVQRFEFELPSRKLFDMRVAFRFGFVEHDRTVLRWSPL